MLIRDKQENEWKNSPLLYMWQPDATDEYSKHLGLFLAWCEICHEFWNGCTKVSLWNWNTLTWLSELFLFYDKETQLQQWEWTTTSIASVNAWQQIPVLHSHQHMSNIHMCCKESSVWAHISHFAVLDNGFNSFKFLVGNLYLLADKTYLLPCFLRGTPAGCHWLDSQVE